MSIAAKTREDRASVTRKQKFFNENRGELCVQKFRLSGTPPVREKQEWIREAREEKLQGIAKGVNSTPGLRSVSRGGAGTAPR